MSNPVAYVSVIGFFTFMMFWTLDGSSGEDMNDAVVRWMSAQAKQVENTTYHVVNMEQ